MKKLILLLFISTCSFAQVTISGATETYLNTTFNQVSYDPEMDNFQCQSIPSGTNSPPLYISDTGTSIYSTIINMPGFGSTPITAFIIRRNGQWNIEARESYDNYIVFYRTVGLNSDSAPPCDATWQKWDSWCFSYGNIDPTNAYTSSIHISGNCVNNESISSITFPQIIDFPIISDFTMSSLTSADGLRKGSTAFNSGTNSLVVYDGCNWLKVKTESMYKPDLISLWMNSGTSNQHIIIYWYHPKPSIVSQFVLQYSVNNSPWTDYQSFSNTTFSYNDNTLAAYTFEDNNTYNWRVKAIETCGISTYSCLKQIFLPYSGYQSSYPSQVKIDAPFTIGSAILVNMVSTSSGTSVTNWEYNLEYFDGAIWQNVLNQSFNFSSFPTNFIISGSSLLLDGKYRVTLHNPSYGTSDQNVIFHYRPSQDACPD